MNMQDIQNKLGRDIILTPKEIAEEMIEVLPVELWNSPELKNMHFIDICCKSGAFLKALLNKLMVAPALISDKDLQDKAVRRKYILDHMLYGVAVCKLSLEVIRLNLYDKAYIKGNIRQITETYEDYVNIFKDKDSRYIKKIREQFGDMKFDVIIGNPPYQESNGGGNGGAGTPIYQEFVNKANNISAKYISMIIPARWYSGGGKKLDDFRNDMLSNNNIRELHDFPNTDEVFSDVYIMGGVCYFLLDKHYSGDCKVVEHRNGNCNETIRKFKEDYSDIFIRNNNAIPILNKVMSLKFESLSRYISTRNPFGFSSTDKGSVIATDRYNIPMYITGNDMRGGGLGYVSDDEIVKGREYLGKHKVIISKASDNMLSFPYSVLNKPFYGGPNEICNDSFLVIGPLVSKEACESLISYLSTKFIRFLVQQHKVSQNTSRDTYRFVPLPDDFTCKWSDEILYKKYNLTPEEIEYIESTIKQMQ